MELRSSTAFPSRSLRLHWRAPQGELGLTVDIALLALYRIFMIKSFKDKETGKVWGRRLSRRLPRELQRAARRKLVLIDSTIFLEDLRSPPGNRLEALKGDRAGQHSIRINDRYRICFTWTGKDAEKVEIVDYHK